ncbi:MAG: KpsF/GutQ family sugar-phosphate isomerase [Bacteroidota bacterium]
MKAEQQILAIAKRTLQLEADSVKDLIKNLDNDFAGSVKLIIKSGGRVVVSGIGKSAIIAQKMVATFNSTGTPSVFMHAADAIHGDLGTIQKNDVVIIISNSGNTPEIKVLAPLIKNGGNTLIAMTGNVDSFLASHADFVLNTYVKKEACPHNLAPTSSTTAQLALGDALAVCLLEYRGFTSADFARFHPGGALGKKLYLKVEDLHDQNPKPTVGPAASINEVILEISSKRLGATAVISKGKLLGIITDGDLRRMMQKHKTYDKLSAKDIMTKKPKAVQKETMAVEALQLMKTNNITQLVVMDQTKFLGFVHLHDLIKEGIF